MPTILGPTIPHVKNKTCLHSKGQESPKIAHSRGSWLRLGRGAAQELRVNRVKVRSARELVAALKAPGQLVLTVLRGEYVFAVAVRR